MTWFIYRTRQFWHAITAVPNEDDLAEIRRVLTPGLFELFQKLQNSEQAHAIKVFKKARQVSDNNDLWAASILHDIGKIQYPLNLVERVIVVLVNKFQKNKRTEADPRKCRFGAHRALEAAQKHPCWGGMLVGQVGAPETVINLIKRHQDPAPINPNNLEDKLLAILQAADNSS